MHIKLWVCHYEDASSDGVRDFLLFELVLDFRNLLRLSSHSRTEIGLDTTATGHMPHVTIAGVAPATAGGRTASVQELEALRAKWITPRSTNEGYPSPITELTRRMVRADVFYVLKKRSPARPSHG